MTPGPAATSQSRTAPLPVPTTPLLGRTAELRDLRALLTQPRTRLLTLTGAGGTGKSRLALELAQDIGTASGEIWFVDVSTIHDPGLVPAAVAAALGVVESGRRPLPGHLQQILSGQPGLLLLDNFEQVMDAADFVGDLLDTCPELVVLATSREALGLCSEHVYVVPPLPLPDPAQLVDFPALRLVPSVALFDDRARARRASFELTDEVLPVVAEICARVDGLPLAIELVAAQIGVFSPALILNRLRAGAPLIGGVYRDLPARQQTLEAVVAWSYDLLEPTEQALFRQCAVFSGGFTARAAARVRGYGEDDGSAAAAPAVLAELVGNSLLRVVVDETGAEPRYSLLETIRDFALGRLELAGETAEARARHAAYFVELAEEARASLRGPSMALVLEDLARDYGNFRAVFAWALVAADLSAGLRLAGALYPFWVARGYLSEARRWLERALPQSQGVAAPIRAVALNAAGVLAGMQHAHEQAAGFFEESLQLRMCLGDTAGVAGAQLNLGVIAHVTGSPDEAQQRFERAHELFRALGNRSGQARAVGGRSRVAREQGNLRHALRLVQESLELFQAVDDLFGAAHALANLGHIRLALGHQPAAAAAFRQALEIWRTLGNTLDLAECLEGVAASLTPGQAGRALHLLGAAEAAREASGAPVAAVDLRRHAELLARVKIQVGEERFALAWREGRALSTREAMELALADDPALDESVAAPVWANSVLSPRERQVARLIALGSSNRDISAALLLSVKTVETHIQHIFAKLGVRARAEVAVWAAQHGLI